MMKNWVRLGMVVMVIPFICFGCASGDKAAAPEETAQVNLEPPLEKSFDNIVFYDIETKPQIETDYPEAMEQLQVSAISALMNKNIYDRVERKGRSDYQGPTLYVKVNVPEMRIVGSAARIWGGAFAGSSGMKMEVQLVDGASGNVLRQKSLESQNNAFAAAWTGGSNDQSLPSDMGKILAEYIAATVPSK